MGTIVKVGYRSEELYGEGFRNSVEVMAHEIFALNNTDILDTLSSTIFNNTDFGKELEILSKYIDEVNGLGCDDEEEVGDFEELYDMVDEAFEDSDVAESYCRKILERVEEIVGKKINYVLWLCDTAQDVKDCYENLDIFPDRVLSEFDEYETSNVIISDLGKDGKLYGYTEYPKCFGTVTL